MSRVEDSLTKAIYEAKGNAQMNLAALEARLSPKISEVTGKIEAESGTRAKQLESVHSQLASRVNGIEVFFTEALEATNSRLKSQEETAARSSAALSEAVRTLDVRTTGDTQALQEAIETLRAEAKASLDFINSETLKRFGQMELNISDLEKSTTAQSQRIGEMIKEEVTTRFSSDV